MAAFPRRRFVGVFPLGAVFLAIVAFAVASAAASVSAGGVAAVGGTWAVVVADGCAWRRVLHGHGGSRADVDWLGGRC